MNFITDKELNDFKLNMRKAILQEKIDLVRSLPVHANHEARFTVIEIINKMEVELMELNKLK